MTRVIQITTMLCGLFLLLCGGFLFYAIPNPDKFVPFCITMAGLVSTLATMIVRE
jgi:hypothetical protein